MKITKILSAVAAASIATTALVATASAVDIKSTGNDNNYFTDKGNIGIFPFSIGTKDEAENGMDVPKGNLAADCGFELEDVAGFSFTITIPEVDSMGLEGNREMFTGLIGGQAIVSLRSVADSRTHNWTPVGEYWGVIDDDLGIATLDDTKAFAFEKVGDYTYELTAEFDTTQMFEDVGDDIIDNRIFMQVWGDDLCSVEFVEGSLLDADGNVLVTVDNTGAITDTGAGADAGDGDSAGSTDGATGEDKNSADTGVEGVAAVAGVAVLAAGAAILSKKRK
ncbi:MAG: hypothetical protein E7485_05725 [Ruminococcaceae bacterium]|nr:hypothetical protein [Oscillospiraceae bacterium]